MKQLRYFTVKRLKKAEQTAKETFEKGGLGSDLPEIKFRLLKLKKIRFLDFITQNKILISKSETRRAISNRAFKIDGIVVEDEKNTKFKGL